MRRLLTPWLVGSSLVLVAVLAAGGCYHTPVDTSEFAQGPAPRRMPSPAKEGQAGCSYEDSLTGGKIFSMYCSYCHNAPTLAERPFSSYKNVATHMRVRANLTGKEYATLMAWMRRWNDVPPGHPPTEPSPKRLTFSQPIAELRPKTPAPAAPGQAQAGGPQDQAARAAPAPEPAAGGPPVAEAR